MGKMIRTVSLDVPPSFFCATSQNNCIFTILNSLLNDIISSSYSYLQITKTRGSTFMMGQESIGHKQKEPEKSSVECSQAQEELKQELEQLKLLLIVTIGSLGAFIVFALTLVVSRLLSDIWPDVSMILRIVAWPVTILGGICCIAAVFASTVRFLQYLKKKLLGK